VPLYVLAGLNTGKFRSGQCWVGVGRTRTCKETECGGRPKFHRRRRCYCRLIEAAVAKRKLTAHQKREALKHRTVGEIVREIARSYNVSGSTISTLNALIAGYHTKTPRRRTTEARC
jgi:hypothetical protein